ncbi:hypothetical protein [Streptomyces sp. CA-106131]|uniref:hypothetical protein n=1 Tax=Streptomyces sp. CA-106131 TaxID=3240045 RepID=UPI003D8DAA83
MADVPLLGRTRGKGHRRSGTRGVKACTVSNPLFPVPRQAIEIKRRRIDRKTPARPQ